MRALTTTAVLLIGCSASGNTHASREAPAEPPVMASGALHPGLVAPYFDGKALEAFRLDDCATAHPLLVAQRRKARGLDVPRLSLLIAICDANAERWVAAADGFKQAADALPLVADFANYNAARALYFSQNHKESRARADKVAPSSPYGQDAALLIGDLLRAHGTASEVAKHYLEYLSNNPRGIRRDEARLRAAEAQEAAGKTEDAIKSYRRLVVLAPLSEHTKEAKRRLAILKNRLSKQQRIALNDSAKDHLERGMALFRAHQSLDSEKELAAALATGDLNKDDTCTAAYHRAQNWWKLRKRTKSAPLFDEAIKLCDETKNLELQVKARYQAGRSYGKMDDAENAIKRYEMVEKKAPTHSYADDARLRQAEEFREIADEANEVARLSSIPARYPNGDMRSEALWRLGWRAYKAKKYTETIQWLEKQIAATPVESDWWREGQPQYWMARSHGHLGHTEKAVAAYKDCIRTYPLSYYSMLSFNRLRESHPDVYEAMVNEVRRPPSGPAARPLHFRDREIYQTAGFQRGLEFLKLGLGREAERELVRVGFRTPPGKKALTDPDDIENAWALAYLFHAAGRYTRSHWVTRWHVTDYKRHWPEGTMRDRWRIAYPLGFWHLVKKYAAKHGYPPALQIGIMREESAFDPLLESWANAHGLTQMIMPTARRFAKGTGVTPTVENLHDPEKNLIIGSNFLAFLVNRYKGEIGLAVPAYNAGEGAVDRFLRERGTWAQDEFREEIPYDQARKYTKRVLASYFAYSYLADRTIPTMSNVIPSSVVPASK